MTDPIAPRPTRGLPFAVRVIGGVVVVGVVIGIGVFAQRLTHDDLALPDAVADVARDDSADAREFAEANSERLSEAYDDADAVTAHYGTDSRTRILVTAVRAKAGPPVPAVFSENQDWVEDGEVTCLVTQSPKGPGSTLCQRDDRELTVRAFVRGSPSLDRLVEITNDVWEDVS